MNILDVKEEEVEARIERLERKGIKDKLCQMFEIQKELMKKYSVPINVDLDSVEGQAVVRKYAYFMVEELFEAMNLMKNRPWTKSTYPVDKNRLDDEIADTIAFFLQLMIIMGYDPEKLRDIYLRKVIVNNFRIRSNY